MSLPRISNRKLFIDNCKYPGDCNKETSRKSFIYDDDDWNIVRTLKTLKTYLNSNKMPSLVSLGYLGTDDSIGCVNYILEICNKNEEELPNIVVHCERDDLRRDLYRLIAAARVNSKKHLKSFSLLGY